MQHSYNQVVVFPDKETTDYLKQVFNNCPFDINFDLFHVVLNESSSSSTALKPDAVYLAKAGTLGYWFDDATNSTQLILPLVSDTLLKRMAELRIADGTKFHSTPLAFMVLVPYMPPLSAPHRNFVLSASEMLSNSNQPLVFTGEMQVYTESEYVPNELYYEDILGNG